MERRPRSSSKKSLDPTAARRALGRRVVRLRQDLVIGPWCGGRRSSVPMAMLRLLALGAGLGSVWLCNKQGAATAQVGCAVNCADFTMRYQDGVQPFWLHIAYHGRLDRTSWHDRMVGSLRMVLRTLLDGKDVAVHCLHGAHGKMACRSHVAPNSVWWVQGPSSLTKCVVRLRSNSPGPGPTVQVQGPTVQVQHI